MDDKAKRTFGTLAARHNAKGVRSVWQIRYRNPLNSSNKIERNFPPDKKSDAERWLGEEHKLVELYRAGEWAWIPPAERTEHKLVYKDPGGLTFSEYCGWYCSQLCTSSGARCPLTTDSHRAASRNLRQEFGRRQLLDITQEDIDR